MNVDYSVPPAGKLQVSEFGWQQGAGRASILLATAVAAVVVMLIAALRFEGVEALRAGVLGLALVACAGTDLLSYRVHDAVTLPALAFALASSALLGEPAIVAASAGALSMSGLLLVAAALTRGGLGGGDVKLAALVGAALGLPVAAFALAEGILLGGGFVICLFATGRLGRDQAFPFAPFLAVTALAYLLSS